jgi:hypothetical protein
MATKETLNEHNVREWMMGLNKMEICLCVNPLAALGL